MGVLLLRIQTGSCNVGLVINSSILGFVLSVLCLINTH